MPIQFQCPHCGLQLSLSDQYAGQTGPCKQCGHDFDARKPNADLGKRKLTLALIINGIGGFGILAVIGGLALMIMKMSP